MVADLSPDRLVHAVSSGPVTLCFTDMEDSTPLAERLADAFSAVLATHRRLLRECFAARGGIEVRAEGEEFFEVFESPTGAVRAAVDAQRALAAHAWPAGVAVRVRIGLLTGEAVWTSDGLVGLDIHRAARVAAAGYGGQILVSGATFDAAEACADGGIDFAYLGVHRLKGLARRERIYQVVARGLPRHFPPLRTLRDSVGNLPVEPTALLGREAELASLGRLLSRRDLRLITITGPAGIGKTRLASEAAAQTSLEFRDGVSYVSLAALTDIAAVHVQVARALQLNEIGGGLEPLVMHLAARETLLFIDNFEHLLGASGDLAELLVRCPGMKILATGREPLHIRGETEFRLGPLALPPVGISSADIIHRSPAVQLFVERAAAVRPGLLLDDKDLGLVAHICQRLDGLPLAIELVAARARLLSLASILDRLPSVLDLASNGPRDVPDRHQSLRAAIGWSYDLLPQDQQSVFRSMAVLMDGSSLESADAVVDPSQAGPGLLDLLEALVSRNLIRVTEDDGEPRFGMFQTIRDYGLEQLEASGEAFDTRLRHLDYFGKRTHVSAGRETQPSHVAFVDGEADNIRSALAWSLTDPKTAIKGLSLATSAGMYWWQRSADEGSEWLTKLLDAAADSPPSLRARARYWLTWLAMDLRPPSDVVALAEAGVAEARRGSDRSGSLVMALNILGDSLVNAGDFARATSISEEAVQRARARDDPRLIGITLWPLGLAAAARGDGPAAREAWIASCEAFERASDDLLIATPLEGLARLALAEGDLPRADELATQCLRALTRSGDVPRFAEALALLAEIRLAQADHADALRCAAQALSVAAEYGNAARVRCALQVAARLCSDREQWTAVATIASFLDQLTSGPERWLLSAEAFQRLRENAAAHLSEDEVAAAVGAARDLDRRRAVQFALEVIRDD
jgi:predicted ATPase/class 3 adenylate cyclase